jgi:hypothetical protein
MIILTVTGRVRPQAESLRSAQFTKCASWRYCDFVSYHILSATLFWFLIMTFQSRRAQSLDILKSTGMRRSNYEPPFLRALWRMGVEIPPPHFMPFIQIAIFAAALCSIVWGVVIWSLVWPRQGMSALAISCGAGLCVGYFLAIYYAYGRRKYRLPEWRSLDESLVA